MVMAKLDRAEFLAVMKDMEDIIERLTVTVKINGHERTKNGCQVIKMVANKVATNEANLILSPGYHSKFPLNRHYTEEEMNENFKDVRKELSFKMFTEDFIVGTEPIRNRIKAMMYEQQKIKEIALQNFFPDAPGVSNAGPIPVLLAIDEAHIRQITVYETIRIHYTQSASEVKLHLRILRELFLQRQLSISTYSF
ncbi:uncharacterized protein TNCV_4045881 [Trichonephila clavipes]|nr:uncharacterized protein TNCV_4045881 [Trichonephila clavipes]